MDFQLIDIQMKARVERYTKPWRLQCSEYTFTNLYMSCSTLFDYQPDEVRKEVSAKCPEQYLFIKDVVFRKLEEMGVDYDYLWNLTIENPKKFFEA